MICGLEVATKDVEQFVGHEERIESCQATYCTGWVLQRRYQGVPLQAKILELRENRDKASSRIFHLSDAVSQLTSESSVHSIEKTRKDSNLDLIAAKIVAYADYLLAKSLSVFGEYYSVLK